MKRRDFVLLSAGSTAALAGCSGSDDDDIQDSDGDGVIDSEDYAPQDPAVQEKSDLQSTETITPTPSDTPTPSPTPSQTPTPSPTPSPTPTSTPQPTSNSFQVTDEYWSGTSRIAEYSRESVTAVIHPDYPEMDTNRVKVYAGLVEFPRGTVVDETLSSSFDRSDGVQEKRLTLVVPDLDSGENYHYMVGLVPADNVDDDINFNEMSLVMESDAFRLVDDGPDIERASYLEELNDDSGDSYSREAIEGAYNLSVSGRTSGESWEVGFFAWKSAHVIGERKSRGRSRPEYVSYELTEGTATELANLLNDDAESLGFSAREKVEFVIDFVQALPYVPDDVSKGFDDYTKFIIETLPEMGGDCEDTSIMLASILEAEAFNYDMILIQPPGHMAAGIADENPSGYYWELDGTKYSYIETTGTGWGVGDLPDEYVGTDAYLYQV